MPCLIWTYTLARYTWYYLLLTASHFFTLTGMAVLTFYCTILVGLILYLDNNATVCDIFYYPYQQMHETHTHIYI
jgi:hypothetical protein